MYLVREAITTNKETTMKVALKNWDSESTDTVSKKKTEPVLAIMTRIRDRARPTRLTYPIMALDFMKSPAKSISTARAVSRPSA